MQTIPLSLYIHFPWCLTKCPYCDFNSYVISDKKLITTYVDKLLVDLAVTAKEYKNRELVSIYFGGGTPSLLSPELIAAIILRTQNYFVCLPEIEITLEANPGTVDLKLCQAFKNAGINRLSLGIQSFTDKNLKNIQRIHSAKEAIEAVEAAKRAGFTNFNLDLMFGLPEQDVTDARKDLTVALDFEPPHISWYQLTLEANVLKHWQLPHDERIWNIQQEGQNLLYQHGLKQYEISAYSRSSNYRCKHNMNYWQYGDYIGIGAGAHGKLTLDNHVVKRYVKVTSPYQYLQSDNLIEKKEEVSKEKIPLEFMLNALRLYQPITFDLFQKRTGFTIKIIEKQLCYAEKLGLIKLQDDAIVTTTQGKNFLNDLLEVFL